MPISLKVAERHELGAALVDQPPRVRIASARLVDPLAEREHRFGARVDPLAQIEDLAGAAVEVLRRLITRGTERATSAIASRSRMTL